MHSMHSMNSEPVHIIQLLTGSTVCLTKMFSKSRSPIKTLPESSTTKLIALRVRWKLTILPNFSTLTGYLFDFVFDVSVENDLGFGRNYQNHFPVALKVHGGCPASASMSEKAKQTEQTGSVKGCFYFVLMTHFSSKTDSS
eukprot:TRINITY_DN1663_c0_g1_i1.p1 TRINITY_DN1663_c0_g1~~TRINITY_DN1663_c0_g1_i1.p1  ORF type:complete len:141 (+),score=6.30 TRINITY_DN1663_c0_g1_i1:102-524(+)